MNTFVLIAILSVGGGQRTAVTLDSYHTEAECKAAAAYARKTNRSVGRAECLKIPVKETT